MNGVTGRMGTRQHLERSLVAIRNQGGIALPDGDRLMPDPILVGRNPEKLRTLAQIYQIDRWSTDVDACLGDPYYEIYFDAQSTVRRAAAISAAIAAGKHIYCEKPTGVNLSEALALYQLAQAKGVKHGVVQDKLFLPGLIKLKSLVDQGFFGRILSVRGEFGYWVWEGDQQPSQRPSWNYRREDGGGITVDMLCHWRYVLDHLFGDIQAVSCLAVRHIPQRWDEEGVPYTATADDAAYATFRLDGDIIVHMNSSWCVRVNRDELLELQVDGTEASAVAGLRHCKMQHRTITPTAIWNPDLPDAHAYSAQWMEVPATGEPENAFKRQWELYLRHVVLDDPFPYDLLEGAKGVQLAELGLLSSERQAWLDVPAIGVASLSGTRS